MLNNFLFDITQFSFKIADKYLFILIFITITMDSTKEKVQSMLRKLPDDCTIEDIQYHLYVLGKIRQGLQVADTQGVLQQAEVEGLLNKWLIE